MGVAFAGIALTWVHDLWRGLEPFPAILMFVIFWIISYQGWLWAFVDREAELSKKFPITSQELRRRRKEFYDWLSSRGTLVIRKRKRPFSS